MRLKDAPRFQEHDLFIDLLEQLNLQFVFKPANAYGDTGLAERPRTRKASPESEEGRGTCFTFTLPVDTTQPSDQKSTPPEHAALKQVGPVTH